MNCENCKYCQPRYNKDRYGNFTTKYMGCNYAPHWGKPIITIGVCPKEEAERKPK